MKTQGCRGVGPESTVDYYRSPFQIWREETMVEAPRKTFLGYVSKWGTKFCRLSEESHGTTQTVTDWRKEWFEIEDATYLNTSHAAMPGDLARSAKLD